MRLAAFKAHGFKSFADPVSFKVGGELTGIVGPNGCGKSNIVDAIRWVLGESRASSLRSIILADVMFNGSEKRKPADWCEVEVRFDNPNGSGGSMWAAYPEIIVRRRISHDGRQEYTINGNAVRRRDVVDLFRGTGVVPSSYGVVEQGMVTEIAEASPEELRRHMEEAAGVSHYKERRRDSERRLQASKENLTQLALVQDGLTKQNEGLKRQARTARRHRQLGEEINHLNALLILSRRAAAERDLAASRSHLREAEAKAKLLNAQLEKLKSQVEEKKQGRTALQAQLDEAQAVLGKAQQAMTAAEHDMHNAVQGKSAAHIRLQEAQQELKNLEVQAERLEQEEQALHQQQAALRRAVEKNAGVAEEEAKELARLQVAREGAQALVDGSRERLTEAQRQLEAQTLRQQMLTERLAELEKRRAEAASASEKLPAAEAVQEDLSAEEAHLESATAARTAARTRHEEGVAAAAAADAAVRQLENEIAKTTAEIDTLRSMLREDGGQEGEERLAHLLQVEAGEWARALDAALGVYAAARAVENLPAAAEDMPPPGTALVDLHPAAATAQPNPTALPPLLEKLHIPDARRQVLAYWLADVYAAPDEATAAAARGQLARHQIIVTPAGAVYGAHSLFMAGEAHGGYNWEQRMRELQQQQQRQQQTLAQKTAAHTAAQDAVRAAAEEVERLTQQLAEAQHKLAERRIEHNRRMEQQRAARQRREELHDLQAALHSEQQQLTAEQQALAASVQTLQGEHSTCTAAFEQEKKKLDNAGAALESYREAAQEAGLARRDLERKTEDIARQLEEMADKKRDNSERKQLIARRVSDFNKEVQQHDEAALHQALDAAKQEAAAGAQQVATHRLAMQQLEEGVSQTEAQREAARSELEAVNQRAADERVKERELSLKAGYESDNLDELDLSPEQLAAIQSEAESGDAAARQEALDDLRRKRDNLGAINFMADSEQRECEARLSEMQRQQSDVETAIAELQSAIRRIDEETQTRLQEMYENVNREFSDLYQRIFDGGEARLEMLGDNLTDMGFELKVRPPGKRLFPVRMLSGGEKAASATAFIFAILRLNPPPFCILDEVDAPLDDNRSQRFVELLHEISKTVQCLVVTHNKATISSMPRLIGVTQEEPGVSKVVTVKLEDALRTAGT